MNGSGYRNSQAHCKECWFLNQNRRRLAISLSKTALGARFGGGDIRRLSAQLEVPVRGFLNFKNEDASPRVHSAASNS